MPKSSYAIITLLTACLVTPVSAQESPLYTGLQVGRLTADFPGFGDATSLGIMLGYDLHRDENGALALETGFTTTIVDGDISGGGGWDADAIAAYGAFRTAGNIYIKAKAGLLKQDIERSGGPLNARDSGLTYGAGVGWRVNSKAGLEIEYTLMSDDLSCLSLTYVTHF